MIKLKKIIEEMYIHGYSPSASQKTFRVPENFDVFREGKYLQL